MAFQPPSDRVEPEESSVQQGKPLDEGVAAAGVLTLVCQDGLELRLRPFAPVVRKNHDWMEESNGYRCGA
jgi:hypothetical protein